MKLKDITIQELNKMVKRGCVTLRNHIPYSDYQSTIEVFGFRTRCGEVETLQRFDINQGSPKYGWYATSENAIVFFIEDRK